jgi:hypothetical protein
MTAWRLPETRVALQTTLIPQSPVRADEEEAGDERANDWMR